MGLFRRKELKFKEEENGKHVSLELSNKTGEPVLGYAFPKDVADRAQKIRNQAKDLRIMADRLDRMADEIEKSSLRGRAEKFLKRPFWKRKTKKAE